MRGKSPSIRDIAKAKALMSMGMRAKGVAKLFGVCTETVNRWNRYYPEVKPEQRLVDGIRILVLLEP